MGTGAATGNSAWTSLPPYPGEEPSLEEHMRWIEEAELRLTAAGQGPLIRGETPPGLTHIAFTRKNGFTKLSKEDRAKAGAIEAAKYDQMVAKAENDELICQEQFRAALSEHKNRLAAIIMASLRPKAGLRLRAMRAAHQVKGTDTFDGPQMWKELKDFADKPIFLAEKRAHDRAYEAARDTKLPNATAAPLKRMRTRFSP